MSHTEGASGMSVGAMLAILGGALMGVGSFLAWAEVSGGGTSVTAKGTDGSDGYVTLVVGVIALVAGIAMTRKANRGLAILVLLAGLVGGGLGVYDAATAEDSVLDAAADELAPTFGASAEEIRGLLDQAVEAGQLSISISIGLYVVIAGGVLALVGGVLGLRGAPTRGEMPAATAPPPMTSEPMGEQPPAPPMPPSEPGAG